MLKKILFIFVFFITCGGISSADTLNIYSDNTDILSNGDNAVYAWKNKKWVSIPGAFWIWNSYYASNSINGEVETFTKTFTIENDINSAQIQFATDNGYILEINNIIFEDNYLGSAFTYITTRDITNYLKQGNNTVKFTVVNNSSIHTDPKLNPGGLIYKLSIDKTKIITDKITTNDKTPRIMYWWGKVNQHIDNTGVWQTDPDGVSGANLDKITYCKKWYPKTIKVIDHKLETIDKWKERGNKNNWTSTKMSMKCVQPGDPEDDTLVIVDPYIGCGFGNKFSTITGKECLPTIIDTNIDKTPRIMYWWGKVNQHIDNAGVWQTDPDGVSGANLDKLTYCKKWYPKLNITNTKDYKNETINTWRAVKNTGAYTATKMSIECISEKTLPSVLPIVDNENMCFDINNEEVDCVATIPEINPIIEQENQEYKELDLVNVSFYRDLVVGVSGNDVKLLQKILKDKGYNIDKIDGIYGEKTRLAVFEYQKNNNLNVSGFINNDEVLDRIKFELLNLD